jgi:hypothetical protein
VVVWLRVGANCGGGGGGDVGASSSQSYETLTHLEIE